MSPCFSVSVCVFLFVAVLLCHSSSSVSLPASSNPLPVSFPKVQYHSPRSRALCPPSILYSIYLSRVPLESFNPGASPSLDLLPGDSAALSKAESWFGLFLKERRIVCDIFLFFQLLLLDSSEIKWRLLPKSPASQTTVISEIQQRSIHLFWGLQTEVKDLNMNSKCYHISFIFI